MIIPLVDMGSYRQQIFFEMRIRVSFIESQSKVLNASNRPHFLLQYCVSAKIELHDIGLELKFTATNRPWHTHGTPRCLIHQLSSALLIAMMEGLLTLTIKMERE
jgi:hypothetical protein